MLRKILPHVAIVISVVYFVLFSIDRVNTAMGFISNDITKWLLVILGAVSIWNAVLIVRDDRRRMRRRAAARRQDMPMHPRRTGRN